MLRVLSGRTCALMLHARRPLRFVDTMTTPVAQGAVVVVLQPFLNATFMEQMLQITRKISHLGIFGVSITTYGTYIWHLKIITQTFSLAFAAILFNLFLKLLVLYYG